MGRELPQVVAGRVAGTVQMVYQEPQIQVVEEEGAAVVVLMATAVLVVQE